MDRRGISAGLAVVGTGMSRAAATAEVGPAAAGELREFQLRAGPVGIDLGDGRAFQAFGYDAATPGPEIRVREGVPG
jgi:FtsP/CotA-like multicopper oxidase with cupredoxin domain